MSPLVMLLATALGLLALVGAKPLPVHDTEAIAIMKELDKISMEVIQIRQAAKKQDQTNSTCTLETARRRKDWASMPASDRRSYSSAVLCLMQLPSRYTNKTAYPGVRSRFDDFVAQHMDITLIHHGSFSFLAFHRYFIWAYETELREECGYQGAQPYWDWFSYVNDMTQSPVFDGSDTSLSGDGAFVAHNGSEGGGPIRIAMPSGSGGGCVKSGPFVNATVNLGPIDPAMDGQPAVPPTGFNPRCLVRDLTSFATSTWMTAANVANLTTGPASVSIGVWQDELQGRGFGGGFMGLHAAGHYAVGGNAADLWSGNNDPAFWLHHAMVDRLWGGWQYMYSAERPGGGGDGRGARVAGTMTMGNVPPTREGTLDDVVGLPGLGGRWGSVRVGDLMDPMGSVVCYLYES